VSGELGKGTVTEPFDQGNDGEYPLDSRTLHAHSRVLTTQSQGNREGDGEGDGEDFRLRRLLEARPCYKGTDRDEDRIDG